MCPWFKAESIGVCISSMMPYIPTIEELERLCFREAFPGCPYYRKSSHEKAAHDTLAEILLRPERSAARAGVKVDE